VAIITVQGDSISVQLTARAEAVRQLDAIADRTSPLDGQVLIRARAASLAEGQRTGILDGVLVGEGGVEFVDITADDIRNGAPLDGGQSVASLASFIERCSTQHGAVSLFEEVTASLPSPGAPLELLRLLELVRDHWNETAGIVAAIGSAVGAVEPYLGCLEGQRARMALLGLGQAASDRGSGSVVNARGGLA
jgi:hypothetical protein